MFILICTSIGAIAYSQKTDSLQLFLTEFQKVAFVRSDSTYKFTRFITSDGKFYFRVGFVDSTTYLDNNLFIGSSDLIPQTGKYKLKFKSVPGSIDTINSYFPIKDIGHNENSLINIADELDCSYILKQIGEPNIIDLKRNTIRILYPCEDLNYCNYYHVFKISFFTDSAKLYSLSGRSVDFNGIQLIRNDSCLLKKRDIENITKQLSKIKLISDITCRQPGNPWILEYNDGAEYKRYIISNYCLRGQKNLRPVATLCYLILGTGNKYFGTNCLLSP